MYVKNQDILKYWGKSDWSSWIQFINSDILVIISFQIAYHGTNGVLSVSDGTATSLNKNVFARAMEELGYPLTDCNGKSQIGLYIMYAFLLTNLIAKWD
jgi:hypothetical protein